MSQEVAKEYGAIAQNTAPYGIVMSVFSLIYSIWFGFAWGIVGWIVFGMILIYNICISWISIKNIKHSKKFKTYDSEEGKRIGKAMGILSGISYTIIWIFIIALLIFRQGKFILPIVTLIIGLHFIPQAKIMSRKIDYFTAPIPIISSIIALYFAFSSNMHWLELFAISGIGGAIATMIYGFYMVYTYKKIAKQYNVEY